MRLLSSRGLLMSQQLSPICFVLQLSTLTVYVRGKGLQIRRGIHLYIIFITTLASSIVVATVGNVRSDAAVHEHA